MDEEEERRQFFNRRTDKAIMSKQIINSHSGAKLRIISRVMDAEPALHFGTVKDEIVLRSTHGGRQKIKATFFEDDRRIQTLVIQKHNSKSGPVEKSSFTFRTHEIATLVRFLAGIKLIDVTDPGTRHVSDDELVEMILDREQLHRVLSGNNDLLIQIAENADLQKDFVALGYRRKQLQWFETLLTNDNVFEEERERCHGSREAVWQEFFEQNTWIFGYGLAYQFLSTLDGKPLQQTLRGSSMLAPGRQPDGIMKTQGLLNAVCFVEIKHHKSPLLAKTEYRNTFRPDAELSGAVAQIQATVQDAVEEWERSIRPENEVGFPTGELIFNFAPKSFLVVGNLSEFVADGGVNQSKYRAFELYRKNLSRPEVVTFDELFERARYIVGHGS